MDKAAADSDLKIRGLGVGGGGGEPSRRGRPGHTKNFFSAFRASVWSKIKGGAPPGSATAKLSLE